MVLNGSKRDTAFDHLSGHATKPFFVGDSVSLIYKIWLFRRHSSFFRHPVDGPYCQEGTEN
jgi:hypothetical protein